MSNNKVQTPYTLVAEGEGVYPYPRKYIICFNGKPLREIHNLRETDIKDWVKLLNEAYQNGVQSI
jgi:hypothetical protein